MSVILFVEIRSKAFDAFTQVCSLILKEGIFYTSCLLPIVTWRVEAQGT